MSKAKETEWALWLALAIGCLMLFGALSSYTSRGGFLVPTFSKLPSAAPDQQDTPEAAFRKEIASGNRPIYAEPACPPGKNIYVAGPKDSTERIVPLYYWSRDGTIRTVRNERGEITWKSIAPEDLPPMRGYGLHEARDSKSFVQTLAELDRMLNERKDR